MNYNTTCSCCKEKFNDTYDGGKYKEYISYTIDNFSIVKKIYTCLNCCIDMFFKVKEVA